MSEQEILNKLQVNDEKLDKIFQSVEKTRKYFLWILIITIAAIIIPAIGLVFVIPQFLSTYSTALNF